MKKLLVIIVTLLAAIGVQAANQAESMLNKCVNKLTSSPTVGITFDMRGAEGSSTGAMTIARDKFLLDTPELSVWFDGKTQWTMAKQQGEVNITEPTAEELHTLNPLLVLNSFRNGYNATMLKGDGNNEAIKLTPKSKNTGMDAVVVNINKSTLFPSSLVMTLTNRSTNSINIKSIKTGKRLNDASFRFNPAQYPNVEVIDLR